ncbi:MAG: hydroxyethylthiazole kinase [Desulfobacterales bacterium]|nr:hydroxyethylthiazole kinase [Desulfobacterales bacterium]
MTLSIDTIWADVEKIRSHAPLVHNITNYVVMNNTANALLALGASPVMAHAKEEVADMATIAGSLVLNIGTLSKEWIAAMHTAAQTAKELKKPLVIDPVGAGATAYRTHAVKGLISAAAPGLIRGNASEIMALWDGDTITKGVDSTSSSDQAVQAAKALAQQHHCAVCITGETDIILSQDQEYRIYNGHAMMPRVTGLGCTATAICGAFAAVNPDMAQAAAHAMAVMGIAGEMAADQAQGPGSLQMHFIDALYQLSADEIARRFRTGA